MPPVNVRLKGSGEGPSIGGFAPVYGCDESDGGGSLLATPTPPSLNDRVLRGATGRALPRGSLSGCRRGDVRLYRLPSEGSTMKVEGCAPLRG
jgi:hypothetical protein